MYLSQFEKKSIALKYQVLPLVTRNVRISYYNAFIQNVRQKNSDK